MTQDSSFKLCNSVHTRNVCFKCHLVSPQQELLSYDNNLFQWQRQLIPEDALEVIHSSSALSTLTAGSRQVNYLSVYTDADI